ncbi:MAG: C4-type zinc ribbon domain-containing protein [Bacteroidales bacterium]|jgi:predicted  nucleic acid-binding Zn-ribbon protein|nr:C4-type zinc ribbon domain-containing protein [Bacteroidales bacterium]MDY0160534.1 C4-type zinc ribbon domain-containing protein [Bacteroidales bacterium]
MATKGQKIEQTTTNTIEKLRNLYRLQLIDSEIDKIKQIRGELPLEVQDLEDEITGLETRLENYENDIAELKKQVETKKQEIKEAELLIKKYTEQQNNVRNNREFESISKEIEFQTLEITLFEKRIKEFTVEVETKQEILDKSKEALNERKQDLSAKQDELEEIIKENQKDIEKLQKQSDELSKKIDSRTLNAYIKIRNNARNGLAVVTVERNACAGCFNLIPPQRQLDIKSGKKVIPCEYCGRILVDKDILEENPPKEVEPEIKPTTKTKKTSKTKK